MRRALSIGALALFVVAALAPLVWCVYASLVPEAALFDATAPVSFSTESYRTVLFERAFARAIASSLIVALMTTSLAIVLAAPCAYALGRLRMRGKTVVLGVVLAVSMFPHISIVGPLFLVLKSLGLIDTRPGHLISTKLTHLGRTLAAAQVIEQTHYFLNIFRPPLIRVTCANTFKTRAMQRNPVAPRKFMQDDTVIRITNDGFGNG